MSVQAQFTPRLLNIGVTKSGNLVDQLRSKRIHSPHTEQRSENRVRSQHRRRVEEVGIDEVIENAQEDHDHPTTEWCGTDDRCDPRDVGWCRGPGEREQALESDTSAGVWTLVRDGLTIGNKKPPMMAGKRRCSAGNHPPSFSSDLLYRGFSTKMVYMMAQAKPTRTPRKARPLTPGDQPRSSSNTIGKAPKSI